MFRRLLVIAAVLATLLPAAAEALELPTTTTTTSTTTTTTSTTTTSSTSSTSTTSTTSTTEPAASQQAASSIGISVPTSTDFGTHPGTSGTSFSASLGTVTVQDDRTCSVVSTCVLTTTVSASSFTTGSGGSMETIPSSSITYLPGSITASTGGPVCTTTLLVATALDTTRTDYTCTSTTSGTKTASWNPSITVTVPTGVVSGSYTGTITHSVA